jgi:hypothetical protein
MSYELNYKVSPVYPFLLRNEGGRIFGNGGGKSSGTGSGTPKSARTSRVLRHDCSSRTPGLSVFPNPPQRGAPLQKTLNVQVSVSPPL